MATGIRGKTVIVTGGASASARRRRCPLPLRAPGCSSRRREASLRLKRR